MIVTPTQACEMGWSIIPVREDKRPYRKWQAYQMRKADREMIVRWREQHNPEAWAVVTGATSGLVVLDFDGDKGRRTLEDMRLKPHVRTGSGGFHLYIQHPGFEVSTINSKSKKDLGARYPGLDIRADGGYAVFHGRNTQGKYTWLREPEPDEVDVLPRELAEYLGLVLRDTDSAGNSRRMDADELLKKALRMAPDGRNNAGFWLACQLRDNGYSRDEAEQIMLQYQADVPEVNCKGWEGSMSDLGIRQQFWQPPGFCLFCG